MNFTIDKATYEDLAVLTDIARSTFVNTFEHLNDPKHFAEYIEKAFNSDQMKKEFEHPDSLFYLVRSAGQVIGYLKINRGSAQTEHHMPDAMEVQRIYLAKEFRGQGIGDHMIDKAKEVAMEQQCAMLWLGVWEDNPEAIAFYKRQGFEVFGEHYFMMGPERQTDKLMKMAL